MSGKEFLKPQGVPEPIVKYLVTNLGLSMSWVYKLKSVMKPNGQIDVWDFRLYDENDVRAKNLKIKDFYSFDNYPTMYRYEGIYNIKTHVVELKKKT